MVNMTNFEEYMLLYADGELNKEDEQALLAFVQQHPKLQAELDAYTATILQPDTTLVFDGKEALMKDEPRKGAIWLGSWKTYAAAATVILFVVLFAINRSGKKEIEPTIVKKETITAPIIDPIQQEDNPLSPAGAVSASGVSGGEERAGGGALAKEDSAAPSSWERAEGEASLAQENKVHSTKPVNAVAVETTERKELVAANKRPNLATKRNKIKPQSVKVKPAVQEPVKTTIQEIAKAEPVKKIQPMEQKPVVVATTKPETESEKTIEEPNEVLAQDSPKKKSRFIAAVLGKKPEILNGLETAVNDKVILAKNVKDDLKNTDVTFKIGKRELFTVRL